MRRSPAKFRRSRLAGLCWCAGVLVFLGCYWWVMANFVIRNFWDPPYELKLDRLEACMAKYPGHPLWLVVGSSRVMEGLQPAVLEDRLKDPAAPLIFNFGMGGVGLFREYGYFKRLLRDHYQPKRVGIEIFGADISRELFTTSEGPFLSTRPRWNELADYERYSSVPPDFVALWKESRWNPMFRYGMLMPNQTLSWRLLPVPGVRRLERMPYDNWGWVLIEAATPPGEYNEEFALNKFRYAPDYADFKIRPNADLVLHAFLDLCRANRIEAFLLKMPESDDFRAMHTPQGDATLAAYLAKIEGAYGVPLIDASAWIERSGFRDGHHLNGAGSAEFTRRFADAVMALKWPGNH